jgi:hypothetical protein
MAFAVNFDAMESQIHPPIQLSKDDSDVFYCLRK